MARKAKPKQHKPKHHTGPLPPRQQRFVQEYLVDLCGTQAAIRSGYSAATAKVTASRLMTQENVKAAVAAGRAKTAERTQITVDRVLLELGRIGFADIRKAVQWGETVAAQDADGNTISVDSVVIRDSKDIDDDTAAALAEVSQTKDGLKVKFHDKQAALVNIGRHLGMFPTKVEHTGKDGGPIEQTFSGFELARRMAYLLDQPAEANKTQ